MHRERSTDWPTTIGSALARARYGSVTFLHKGRTTSFSYSELLDAAVGTTDGLRRLGVRHGDRVLVAVPTGPDLLIVFFGCVLIGAIPCLLSTAAGFGSVRAFQRKVRKLRELLEARAVVTSDDLHGALGPHGEKVSFAEPGDLCGGQVGAQVIESREEGVAFLQLTSGTTKDPKAVVITHRAVAANTRQAARRARFSRGTVFVNWLPLYHDMGLMSVMNGLFSDCDVVLSTPFAFLRRPVSWMENVQRFGGTTSAAPAFALRYLLQRTSPRELVGIDLSSLTALFVGAEPVAGDLLREFEEQLSGCGLAQNVLVPCYGLAEATLAVSFRSVGTKLNTMVLSRSRLTGRGRVGQPSSEADAVEIVSCGRPLTGMEVVVRDEDGQSMESGVVGRICVRGPNLFSGYWPDVTARSIQKGELDTGDLGFMDHDELYVTGRAKDVIIIRGHNHHPEEIEWIVSRVRGIRRVVALPLRTAGTDTDELGVLAECERGSRPIEADLAASVRKLVHAESGLTVDLVSFVPSGTIPVTTSGKPRRGLAREILFRIAESESRADPTEPCTKKNTDAEDAVEARENR